MALRVTDHLVADVAARLGEGGWRYSTRQLYYAVCAEVERPQASTGAAQAGCGGALVALSIVGGIYASIYVGLVVIPGLVILGMGLQALRAERNRPTTRALALGYEEFIRDHLEPLRRSSPGALDGLIGPEVVATTGDRTPTPEAPLVVCDRAESAAVLGSALEVAGLGARVVDEASAPTRPEGRDRVYALHDADPRGCGLAGRLRAAGAAEVVDVGLRPGHIQGRRIQVLEGAPVIVPAAVGELLSPDEIIWLAEGRRVELATLSPAELAAAVGAAVDPDAPARVPPGGAEGIRFSAVDPVGVGTSRGSSA